MFCDVCDVIRRSAATSAHYVHESFPCPFFEVVTCIFRMLIILTHCIGETGIRICRNIACRNLRELLDIRTHFLCAECTIETNAQRLCMHHRSVECLESLPAQRASRSIGDRSADHHRHCFLSCIPEIFLDCEDCCLRVECVEYGFNEQQVRSSINESAYLLVISIHRLIEGEGAETRIVYIGRKRECLI